MDPTTARPGGSPIGVQAAISCNALGTRPSAQLPPFVSITLSFLARVSTAAQRSADGPKHGCAGLESGLTSESNTSPRPGHKHRSLRVSCGHS